MMTNSKKWKIPFVLCFVFGLSGCVAPTEAPKPAVTKLSKACQENYDLSTATDISFEEVAKPEVSVSIPIGDNSPCLEFEDGAKSSYTIFRLDRSKLSDTTVVAGAWGEPSRILAPLVTVLTAEGAVSREFAADRFLYRGSHLAVSFRPRMEEHYVVVRSNDQLVGEEYIDVQSAVQANHNIYTGFVWYTSLDTQTKVTFSHYGVAKVRAYTSEK